MLMLGVQQGDYIMIGDEIKIRVVKAGEVFRLGIEAPRSMTILRSNLYEWSNPDYKDEAFEKSKPVDAETLRAMANQKKEKAAAKG